MGGEIRANRNADAAIVGGIARYTVDIIATGTGAALGGLVGLETGPGALATAAVSGIALPILVDLSGIREQVGDLASGYALGLDPQSCAPKK